MHKIKISDHFYRLFDLLKKDKIQKFDEILQDDVDQADLYSSLDKEISSSSVPVPDMSSMADRIWKKSQQDQIKVVAFPSRRRYRTAGWVLTAAAGLALFFISGLWQTIFLSSSEHSLDVALNAGSAVRQPANIKVKPGQKFKLARGERLLSGEKSKITVTLPSGLLIMDSKTTLHLKIFMKIKEKPLLAWAVPKGKVDISLKKDTYSGFSLSTPHGNITVTGTEFSVVVTLKNTFVQVKRGQVVCFLVSNTNRRLILDAGKAVRITSEAFIPTRDGGVLRQAQEPVGNRGRLRQAIGNHSSEPIKGRGSSAKKAVPGFKEKVYLKNGMVITGKVLSQNKTTLVVKTAGGIIRISRKKVKNIRYTR